MLYRWIRNTHLALGLLAFPMLLMYGLSAVQMAHNSWFSLKPAVTESEIVAGPFARDDGRALARELMQRFGLRGELEQVRARDSGFRLRIARPGTVYEVDYSREGGRAKVRTSVAGFMGLLNRLHHLAGLGHELGLLNVWGGFVVLASVALLGLGLSGLYLWFRIHEERKTGAILLALSLAYSLTVIVLIRVA